MIEHHAEPNMLLGMASILATWFVVASVLFVFLHFYY